ncbi:MAG TPA: 50S ribosomal protein L21 [Bacteroidales bacterium]|jgi:large subunit ribosomal protein L21|nr:50S ribosomal protein L21 [Bacteroidales bacterium]MCZ2416418.1 50S ribosomal protein L21 [Burkholderiales bacterium]OQC56740.1 MAG: 50S ribosomal protein L21 [Bacteroidetes bacterium ADurb.Bin013]MBV6456806.1 50S ribosomal protein L21 [Bacteroidales bacterium]MCZ2316593.1 50S ribosomal protein L21 [Bacteroidales bacterium]
MYAIVDIAGQQFKVQEGWKVFVNRLEVEEGESINFDKVLLKDHDGKVQLGKPYLEGAAVNATVLKHLKGDKVLVFKKKRRKGHQKCNGHRQHLTQIRIDTIS